MRYKDRCMAGFFWKLGSYNFVSGLVKENGKPTNHILHYPYLYYYFIIIPGSWYLYHELTHY